MVRTRFPFIFSLSFYPPAMTDARADDSDDDTWDWGATPEVQQEMDDAQITRALFCGGATCATPQLAAAQTKARSGFDLEAACAGLSTYERIRLLNCARRMDDHEVDGAPDGAVIEAKFAGPGGMSLNDDELLKPVVENDPLLQYVAGLAGLTGTMIGVTTRRKQMPPHLQRRRHLCLRQMLKLLRSANNLAEPKSCCTSTAWPTICQKSLSLRTTIHITLTRTRTGESTKRCSKMLSAQTRIGTRSSATPRFSRASLCWMLGVARGSSRCLLPGLVLNVSLV